ncbi:MAG TPA: LolA-related protein [Usitatibacter sp.]|jgi:hypothetical protein|nr:LolA-related protein [Usitatibacter sp.]
MKLALAAAALALVVQPAAASFDVPALMRLLGTAKDLELPYVERRYSPILVAPVESSGTLVYHRPEVVEKIVAKPRRERLRILLDEVVVERDGKEQRLAFASAPALAGLAASIRGVLSGDAALLETHFDLKIGGDEAAWTLDLTPKDDTLRSRLEGIVVSGHGGRVAKVETFEASGDRTVTEIR